MSSLAHLISDLPGTADLGTFAVTIFCMGRRRLNGQSVSWDTLM